MTVSTEVLTTRPTCQAARASLRAYVRAGLSTPAAQRVSGHLECCRDCTAVYLELIEGYDTVPGRRLLPARAGRALLGVAVAAVLGGLVMARLTPFGGAEDSAPDAAPIEAPPAAAAVRTGSGDGDDSETPDKNRHPKPTPDSHPTPAEPASTSAFAAPGAQAPHVPSSDGAASNGHGGKGGSGGGQPSPTPPAVVTISSDLAPDLPVPAITITLPALPGAGLLTVP